MCLHYSTKISFNFFIKNFISNFNRVKVKNKPYPFLVKKLFFGFSKKFGGRNLFGRLVCRRKGGGHKRMFRFLDFRKIIWDLEAVVLNFEYDPFRNSFIALICYLNGILSFNLISSGLRIGDYLINTLDANLLRNSSTSFLRVFNTGQLLHSVEFMPFAVCSIARASGCRAMLIKPYIGSALHQTVGLRLPSGEERKFSSFCVATVGFVSNENFFSTHYKKAGQLRNLGVRPIVRGVAMNPIDHPHGGGHGKTSGARGRRCKMTFKGKIAKNVFTRDKKRTLFYLLRSRYAIKRLNLHVA